jgi:hypothetical protein
MRFKKPSACGTTKAKNRKPNAAGKKYQRIGLAVKSGKNVTSMKNTAKVSPKLRLLDPFILVPDIKKI